MIENVSFQFLSVKKYYAGFIQKRSLQYQSKFNISRLVDLRIQIGQVQVVQHRGWVRDGSQGIIS